VTCQETELALGAYVLGALEPAERRQVREHLADCPACAAEVAELEGLPALLDRVRPEDLQAAPVAPSPDLFDRVLAAAAAEDRRVRHRWLLVAAAVLVLLAGGVGTAVWAGWGSDPVHTAASGPVHMSVRALGDTAGTTLDVRVAGLPPRENCRLLVVDDGGTRHAAGEWLATYEGEASFRGWTDVTRSDLAAVVLLGTDGRVLVRLSL
jgi:anti-sigma factor RsiW